MAERTSTTTGTPATTTPTGEQGDPWFNSARLTTVQFMLYTIVRRIDAPNIWEEAACTADILQKIRQVDVDHYSRLSISGRIDYVLQMMNLTSKFPKNLYIIPADWECYIPGVVGILPLQDEDTLRITYFVYITPYLHKLGYDINAPPASDNLILALQNLASDPSAVMTIWNIYFTNGGNACLKIGDTTMFEYYTAYVAITLNPHVATSQLLATTNAALASLAACPGEMRRIRDKYKTVTSASYNQFNSGILDALNADLLRIASAPAVVQPPPKSAAKSPPHRPS